MNEVGQSDPPGTGESSPTAPASAEFPGEQTSASDFHHAVARPPAMHVALFASRRRHEVDAVESAEFVNHAPRAAELVVAGPAVQRQAHSTEERPSALGFQKRATQILGFLNE